MTDHKVKVLYIAGMMRSGSTLLGRLLAELPGVVNIGELGYILSSEFRETTLCGCREPVTQCPFWQEVFECAFGGLHNLDLHSLRRVRQSYRFRHLPRLLLTRKALVQQQQFQDYIHTLDALYQAIAKVSGARVIVDVSKHVILGSILADYAPTLDVRTLHLVRDSRAVAYSQQRIKTDPCSFAHPGQLPIISPLKTALLWNVTNALLDIKNISLHSSFLRYEDLVADPGKVVASLWKWMEEPAPSVSFLEGASINLQTSHTIAGNPDRWQSTIRIKIDNEWESQMKQSQRILMTALTWPLLLHYGYLRPLPSPEDRQRIVPMGVL